MRASGRSKRAPGGRRHGIRGSGFGMGDSNAESRIPNGVAGQGPRRGLVPGSRPGRPRWALRQRSRRLLPLTPIMAGAGGRGRCTGSPRWRGIRRARRGRGRGRPRGQRHPRRPVAWGPRQRARRQGGLGRQDRPEGAVQAAAGCLRLARPATRWIRWRARLVARARPRAARRPCGWPRHPRARCRGRRRRAVLVRLGRPAPRLVIACGRLGGLLGRPGTGWLGAAGHRSRVLRGGRPGLGYPGGGSRAFVSGMIALCRRVRSRAGGRGRLRGGRRPKVAWPLGRAGHPRRPVAWGARALRGAAGLGRRGLRPGRRVVGLRSRRLVRGRPLAVVPGRRFAGVRPLLSARCFARARPLLSVRCARRGPGGGG